VDRTTVGTITNVEVDRIVGVEPLCKDGAACPNAAWTARIIVATYAAAFTFAPGRFIKNFDGGNAQVENEQGHGGGENAIAQGGRRFIL
jgi:hypothetical protein